MSSLLYSMTSGASSFDFCGQMVMNINELIYTQTYGNEY